MVDLPPDCHGPCLFDRRAHHLDVPRRRAGHEEGRDGRSVRERFIVVLCQPVKDAARIGDQHAVGVFGVKLVGHASEFSAELAAMELPHADEAGGLVAVSVKAGAGPRVTNLLHRTVLFDEPLTIEPLEPG